MQKSLAFTIISPENHQRFYNSIVEFRAANLLPINEPEFYRQNDEDLHNYLYVEEFGELIDADNEVARADAIVDSIYVTYGKLVHLGLRNFADAIHDTAPLVRDVSIMMYHGKKRFGEDVFWQLWDEVHQSNLTKICIDEKQRDETVAQYAKLGVETVAEESPRGWIIKVKTEVVIDGDVYPVGKVLKNKYYKKANLSKILDQAKKQKAA